MTPHYAYYLVFFVFGLPLLYFEIRRYRRRRAASARTYEACGRLMERHGNHRWRVGRTR